MLIPFGLVEGIVDHPNVTWAWLGLLGFSVVAAVVAVNWLYLTAVRTLGAARAASYTYLEPFLAVAAAAVLISERVLPLQILGGLVILSGLAIGTPGPLGIAGPESAGGAVPEIAAYAGDAVFGFEPVLGRLDWSRPEKAREGCDAGCEPAEDNQ